MQRFQKISEAYATLSDPNKCQLYNQYIAEGANAADQMPDGHVPPSGFGFGPGGGGGGMHHMSNEDAHQFFSSFFGNSDPFSDGMPGMYFSTSMGGMPRDIQSMPSSFAYCLGRPHFSYGRRQWPE